MKKFEGGRGVTMIELVVGMAILGILLVGLGLVTGKIQKTNISTSAQTAASHLVQEKIEYANKIPYNRLSVTTSFNTLAGLAPEVRYDTDNYPPESISLGRRTFTRYTFVERVDGDASMAPLASTDSDKGLKMVTVSVVWTHGGETKVHQVKNIVSNPENPLANATLQGVVTHDGAPVADALVNVVGNMGWKTQTSSTGSYTLRVMPGSYSLSVSKAGYRRETSPVSVSASAITPKDVALLRLSTGTVKGNLWTTPNSLLISQVVAKYDASSYEYEWVEVYNPTDNDIAIAQCCTVLGETTTLISLFYEGEQTNGAKKINVTEYRNLVVPSHGYYLFANTTTLVVGGVNIDVDASYKYSGLNTYNDPPTANASGQCNVIYDNNHGAVALALPTISTSSLNAYIDVVGWTNGGWPTNIPSIDPKPFIDSNPLNSGGSGPGEQIVRRSSATGISPNGGRAYDSDNNNNNFMNNNNLNVVNFSPKNYSTPRETPTGGVPAYGAVVSVYDGLSIPVVAERSLSDIAGTTHTGAAPAATFRLPDVSSGTWFMDVSTNSYYYEKQDLAVAGGVENTVGDIVLKMGSSPRGVLKGNVRDVAGNPVPLAGIKLVGTSLSSAGRTYITRSSAATGQFMQALAPGDYKVSANMDSYGISNSNYSSETKTVTVSQGVLSTLDFSLSQGGRLFGTVTRDGVNPLPGVLIRASRGMSWQMETLSGNDGRFQFINLTTGTYAVEPVLSDKEVGSPASVSISASGPGFNQGVGSFTVKEGMSKIRGRVFADGKPVETGVLVIAHTGALPADIALTPTSAKDSPNFFTVTDAEGYYTLEVIGGGPYNISAEYASAVQTAATRKTQDNISVSKGATASGIDLSW